jgi:hexosaminidase
MAKGMVLLTALCALAQPASAEETQTPPLMPLPARTSAGEGSFAVDKAFTIQLRGSYDDRVQRAAGRFLTHLAQRTGIPVNSIGEGAGNFVITCSRQGEKVQKLDEGESYRLAVGAAEVDLDAATPLGVIHGLQTFLQLVQSNRQGFAVPAVVIEDRPRFPWRGLLIDVSRHFMPVEVIKRNLDGMEAVKFNVLHWHLSDDHGFRVESKRFPRFQQLASDGLYYTQEQIQDVIAYARDRGIRIVPEFDVPGHTTSWFVAYPELASHPGPYHIARELGVHDAAMDPTRDHTYHFLDDFVGEMSRLFTDEYFHIGGDEVNGKQWAGNKKIRQFERKHHLKNGHDLQAYFNQRLQKIVKGHGRIMVGWDEILHADLPKDVVVQSWRGQQSLADASRQGYRGLLSFGYYLDLIQPASQHYLIDPIGGAAADLLPEEQRRILGGEACMWAEFVTPENIDGRIWPRAAAVAERLWSPQEVRDLDSMYSRLKKVNEQLDGIGLTHRDSYRRMMERLAGSPNIGPLFYLADVLEPVKGYARPRARAYETTTPLNRMVDALHPESDNAREFAGKVQRFVNKQATLQEIGSIRNWFLFWIDNDDKLQPILQQNSLLTEIIPVSQNLKAVAETGLKALEYVNANLPPPAGWREQQLTMLKQAQQPQAEMLNMIAPSVQKLVEAIPETPAAAGGTEASKPPL